MKPSKPSRHEERYLNLLLDPLDECANYKPKFGTNDEDGISLERFAEMYGEDRSTIGSGWIRRLCIRHTKQLGA